MLQKLQNCSKIFFVLYMKSKLFLLISTRSILFTDPLLFQIHSHFIHRSILFTDPLFMLCIATCAFLIFLYEIWHKTDLFLKSMTISAHIMFKSTTGIYCQGTPMISFLFRPNRKKGMSHSIVVPFSFFYICVKGFIDFLDSRQYSYCYCVLTNFQVTKQYYTG